MDELVGEAEVYAMNGRVLVFRAEDRELLARAVAVVLSPQDLALLSRATDGPVSRQTVTRFVEATIRTELRRMRNYLVRREERSAGPSTRDMLRSGLRRLHAWFARPAVLIRIGEHTEPYGVAEWLERTEELR